MTRAPQEVIEHLDENALVGPSHGMIYVLFSEGGILDIEDVELSNPVSEWVYGGTLGSTFSREREQAVINHVFGGEKLQPEREPRFYVQNDTHGNTYFDLSLRDAYGDQVPTQQDFNAHGKPTYERGMSEEQADLFIQAFGGTKEKLV